MANLCLCQRRPIAAVEQTKPFFPHEIIHFSLIFLYPSPYYILRWKVITFCVNNFNTFCVDIITFCVSITFCGDCYYILRLNNQHELGNFYCFSV